MRPSRKTTIRNRLSAFLTLALLGLWALPAASPADPPTLGCRYVEAGPPGPVGNVLEIGGSGNVAIGRDGAEIAVSLTGSIGIRLERRIECSGGVPTVATVDRIAYEAPPDLGQVLIDERGGRLEPGASEEPGGGEIELFIGLPRPRSDRPNVHVLGTAGADLIGAGDLTRGRIGVNLDWGRDLSQKDADVVVTGAPGAILKIDGYGGNDRLSAAGGREFAGPVSLSAPVLIGGDGKDLLIGGPRGDQVEGDDGDDLLFGRGGNDTLRPGPGRDRALAGAGNDWIDGARVSEDDRQFDLYAGAAGNDYISARYGGRDRVLCGRGLDETWVDPFDVWNGCDEVRIAKR